jgi:hypothetical protein
MYLFLEVLILPLSTIFSNFILLSVRVFSPVLVVLIVYPSWAVNFVSLRNRIPNDT